MIIDKPPYGEMNNWLNSLQTAINNRNKKQILALYDKNIENNEFTWEIFMKRMLIKHTKYGHLEPRSASL
jgi:hypothetical protein